MISNQAKTLKTTLKALNITDVFGKLSVNTERRYIDRINGKNLYEYGNAVAHVEYIDDATYQKLVETLPYVKIYRNKNCNFSIIKY
jgi:hypothetical protein